MTKPDKDTIEAQANEAPPQANEALPSAKMEAVERRERNQKGSDLLAATQVALTLDTFSFSDEDSAALKRACVARYGEFALADETERLLATLSIGLQNAAMTSLQYVAADDTFRGRSEELRNATSAAKTIVDLLDALDRHRGRGKQNATVGQVTVETGGQAIVGNVNSEGRRNKPDDTEDPDKDSTP